MLSEPPGTCRQFNCTMSVKNNLRSSSCVRVMDGLQYQSIYKWSLSRRNFSEVFFQMKKMQFFKTQTTLSDGCQRVLVNIFVIQCFPLKSSRTSLWSLTFSSCPIVRWSCVFALRIPLLSSLTPIPPICLPPPPPPPFGTNKRLCQDTSELQCCSSLLFPECTAAGGSWQSPS